MPDHRLCNLQRLHRREALGALLVMLAGCTGMPAGDETQRVVARLRDYQGLMLRMDADGAAECFALDAETSHADGPPVRGREAIRAFLKSFSAYKVLDYRLVAEQTLVEGPRAVQRGSFAQTVTLPQGNTVQVNGLFEITWRREADGQWRLARLHTMPPKSS